MKGSSWSIGWCPPPFGVVPNLRNHKTWFQLGTALHQTIWLLDATFQWLSRSTSARYQMCLHQHPGENLTVGGQDHAAAPNWCPARHPAIDSEATINNSGARSSGFSTHEVPIAPKSPPCSEPDRNQREEVELCR